MSYCAYRCSGTGIAADGAADDGATGCPYDTRARCRAGRGGGRLWRSLLRRRIGWINPGLLNSPGLTCGFVILLLLRGLSVGRINVLLRSCFGSNSKRKGEEIGAFSVHGVLPVVEAIHIEMLFGFRISEVACGITKIYLLWRWHFRA